MIRKAGNFKFDQHRHISLIWWNISKDIKEQAGEEVYQAQLKVVFKKFLTLAMIRIVST